MEKVKVKKRRVYGPGEILWLAILFLLAALILYPLFWILMSSFKDYNGIYGDVWGLPDICLEPGDLPVFPQQPDCNDMYAGWCGLCIDLFRIWNLPDEGQTGKFRISLLSLRPAAVTAGLPASAVHAAEEPEA